MTHFNEVIKMEDKEIPETRTDKGPRMLPMVKLSNRKTYFIDDRLRQLRNIHNPHDYIDDYETKLTMTDLDEVWKQADDFTQFVTVKCTLCGKILYSGPEKDTKHLIIYCTDC